MQPDDILMTQVRIDATHQKALGRLGIETVSDLLYHLPTRYEDVSAVQSVGSLTVGEDASVYGVVGGLKTRKAWKSRKPIAEGWVEDGTARMKIMWFNQPYMAKMLTDGAYVKLAGKVSGSAEKPYLANPEIETLKNLPIDRHDSIFRDTGDSTETLYPVYRETKGVTSKWFFHTVQKCFASGVLDNLIDPIPKNIRKTYNLPDLSTALIWIHTPKKTEHAESARKRFAFEEVFYIQLKKAQERAEVSAATSYRFNTDSEHIRTFVDRFPFTLTSAQQNAIKDILTDFGTTRPMSRLLEGDVGSGKTAVAATTAYAVATSRPPEGTKGNEHSTSAKNIAFGNLQVAYMAPTEILAKQHFESFIEYFKHLPIQIGLITGSGCMKFPSKVSPDKPTKLSKAQLLRWVKNGEIPILIGTHALMYKSVEFKHLAYVIIDEQHRFGTSQRRALAKKDVRLPHLLSMTATPIPRTLALTVYGDLDITLLDEMPRGRKPIITKIVVPTKTKEVYEHVRSELATGRQAYVICPRIDEPDPEKETALRLKSVKAEAVRLKKDVFPDAHIAILHSKMTPKEKEEVMQDFLDHRIDILVATSVVEVGVNVPNATNIIIEGAERFGLSQLHQLRGRVIRSEHQAYCFAVTSKDSQGRGGKTLERLKALTTAKNGFELAEFDLALRGSGELYGGKQWGLTDLGMEAIKNIKMVEAARKEASALVATDPTLKKHPLIATKIAALGETLHME
ncbi:ATP-dependent DNA helicase RecG [Candidatus Kaiserbacteria bacterium]|nr:ATP-dependent DNA helicase RecG [Candidatus Kaiserbacteria bacterium]